MTTAKATADTLIQEMTKGKEVHAEFTTMMNQQILISGQSFEFWDKKFRLKIPTDNINPETCRQLEMKVLELNQEATFLSNMAYARSQMLKHSNGGLFLQKFQTLVQEYKQTGKRLPANATLDNLARVQQQDVEAAKVLADIEVKYWKGILDHLGRCQSILNTSAMLISAEMKALTSEKYLDGMETKYNRS